MAIATADAVAVTEAIPASIVATAAVAVAV